MRILFIDNYDSFTYNIVELLRSLKGVHFTLKKNDELRNIDIQDYDKVIISPGPDLPKAANDLMWFLDNYLEQIPCLGICLGHQAIAEFYKGSLEQYGNPKHGEKTRVIIERSETIFANLPTSFEVGLYHSWYVNKDTLPAELLVTAKNQDGIIMALRHKSLPIFSVQFHPESFMSEFGKEILNNFLQS